MSLQPITAIPIRRENWPAQTRLSAVAAQMRKLGYVLVQCREQLLAVRVH